NDPVTLAALYPGLIITGTTNTYTNVWVTNLTAYFTNYPFDPFGAPPHVAFTTNRSVSVQTLFHHTFANLLSIQPVPGGWITVPMSQIPSATSVALVTTLTTNIGVTNFPWAPAGTEAEFTNVTLRTYT